MSSRLLAVVLGALLLAPVSAHFASLDRPDAGDASRDGLDGEALPPSCFTLEAPGPDWRALEPAELKEIAPEAVMGLAGPRGVRVVLLAEPAGRTDLESALQSTLEEQGLQMVSTAFVEELEVAGRRALRGMVNGRRDGVWMRYHAVVVRESKELYRLVSWGRSDNVPADGSTFEEATAGLRLVEGVSLEALPRGGQHPDAEGPGWRIRGGDFIDAALGYEIAPRGPWRVASERELAALGDLAAFGLVSEQYDALVGVAVERLPKVDQSTYRETSRRRALGDAFASGGLDLEVAGRQVAFRQATVPALPGTNDETRLLAHGLFFEDDLCVNLVARYPASLSKQMAKALPQALSSLRFLTEEERAPLAAQMRAAPVPMDAVGSGWALRERTYTNFTHGLRWTAPEGIWDAHSLDGVEDAEPGALVSLHERELGVRGTILVAPVGELDASTWHAAALEPLLGPPEVEAFPFEEVELGAVTGRLTWGTAHDGSRLRLGVVTAVRGETAVRLVLGAPEEIAVEARAIVLAALRGLSLAPSSLPPTEMRQGSYLDLRLGFGIDSPDPSWRFREVHVDRYGPRAARADGVLACFEAEEGRGVYAAAAWCEALAADSGADASFVPSALRSLGRIPERAPDETSSATLRGRACQLLTWREGDRRIEVVLLRRGRTALAVCLAAGPADPPPRTWLAGFRVLE